MAAGALYFTEVIIREKETSNPRQSTRDIWHYGGMKALIAGLVVLGFVFGSPPAAVAENQALKRLSPTQVGIAFGRGVDVNLPDLPSSLTSGNLPLDDTRFVGLYVGRDGHTLGEASTLLDRTWFRNLRQGYAFSLLKHSGLQTNWEAGLAYTLSTPSLRLGSITTSLKVGGGFSHAFSRPSYEDGPFAEPNRRYRSQFLLLIENHWQLSQDDRWSLVFRVHHRSGVYGLIAPRNVGSNFLAVGIERRL